jgi:DNA-binding winged helix-turn-helix (wHTH) protein
MEPSDTAYLDIRLSTAPGTLWQTVKLHDDVTDLGRPEEGEPGVNLVLKTISRKHAHIVREGTGEGAAYFLENVRGKAGIRLYEMILRPGERYILGHGYIFHIPAVLTTLSDPSLAITFCLDSKRTTCLSINFDQPPTVSIFGQLVEFSPQEYALLEYLYIHKDQLCPYRDIIAYVWTDQLRTPKSIQTPLERLRANPYEYSEKKEQLYIVLCEVRRRIREASGGIMLIETIRGQGLCLRT